jgi:hypothetical protein
VLVTLALSDSDNEDEDEMTFTRACFTPIMPDGDGDNDVGFIPEVHWCPTKSQPTVFDIGHVAYESEDSSVEDFTQMSTDERKIEVDGNRPKSHY